LAPMALVLDPKATPKAIDFHRGSKDGAIRYRGIYHLDGDSLKVCYLLGSRGEERPKEFATTAAGEYLFILRRVGP
jgi:uncharacterized protein (TIGR03067 family)